MFNKRKLVVIVTSLCLTLSNVLPVLATSDRKTNSPIIEKKVYLQSVDIKDLKNHKDLEKYITDHGFDKKYKEFIKNLKSSERFNTEGTNQEKDISKLNSDSRNEQNKNVAISKNLIKELDKDTKDELTKKYGLENPSNINNEDFNDEEIDINATVLVESIQSLSGTYYGNVWYLTYSVSDYNFQINVLNVGSDPLDSISGYVDKYNKDQYAWKFATYTSFNKAQANDGKVFTWYTTKDMVAEKFEYSITVVEDGYTYSYNNVNEEDYIRYNFDADDYNILQAKGGQRHHFVSNYALSSCRYNADTAPAIRMMAADHIYTPNWGSSASAVAFRNEEIRLIGAKRYEELLQMEVNGLKATPDSEGKYSNLQQKYYDEVIIALYLAEIYFDIY